MDDSTMDSHKNEYSFEYDPASMQQFLYSETGSRLYYEIIELTGEIAKLRSEHESVCEKAQWSDAEHPGDIIDRHFNHILSSERRLSELYEQFQNEYMESCS
jgi:hypothetical protein